MQVRLSQGPRLHGTGLEATEVQVTPKSLCWRLTTLMGFAARG